MPHHSHLGDDGLPVVQAGEQPAGGKKGSATAVPQKERVPANRRGPVRERVVQSVEDAATAREDRPAQGPRPTAGNAGVLRRKRWQVDSPSEEEDEVETIGALQQKRARQAPLKAPVVEQEAPASDLDSFAAYAEFMTDGEREFLYHLCERLGFGGLAGISRPTAIDQTPYSSAFGQLSAGLHEMFLAAQKQPRVERELREEAESLQRELAGARGKLAEVERRLAKADCDAADARGKLAVAIKRDVERNDRVCKLEQDKTLLQERVTVKEKRIDILQRESAARLAEVKRLEGEVARLQTEGSSAAAAAVAAFKQSAEYNKAMGEAMKAGALANVEMLKKKGAIDFVKAAQPTVPAQPIVPAAKDAPAVTAKDAPPAGGVVAGPAEGARSGSGESIARPAEGSQQTPPTQSEVSRAGFLAAHTRADGTIETPSPTARGSDQTSRAQPPPHTEGEEAEAAKE